MLVGGIALVSALLAAAVCAGTGAFAGYSWIWLLPACFAGGFLGVTVLVFLFLLAACAVVDLNKPQEHDSPFYRRLTCLCIDAVILFARVHLHIAGMEQVPGEGRFLLVCNHSSDADPALLLSAFKKHQIAFISKRENYAKPIVGKLMHKLMCQPVNRENDREALKTILKCIDLIKEDEVSIGVFPEGYIHEDRKLHHFRHGVFKIAQRTKIPIVVCTLKNTPPVFRNAARLKRTDIELRVLDVIGPEEYAGVTTVDLGERIYRMMAEDLGPDRVAAEEST